MGARYERLRPRVGVVMACRCPQYRGVTITDPAKHREWHALVVEQGGPDGLVNAETLKAARGFKTATVSGETILDVRARESGKRASGALRRASR